MPVKQRTKIERDALLVSGQPCIVAPKEVAKCTKDYRTDPEVLLGCIIVSGTLDTAEVLRAEIRLTAGLPLTEAQSAAHNAFRRVWASPTDQQRRDVLAWAKKISASTRRSIRTTRFVWNGPAA
jgi:hypothetical protein